MSLIRYHGVLLCYEIAVDWLSVSMGFGTFSSPIARMRIRGLVCSMFAAQTTWFGIPDFCNTRKE